MADRYIVFIVAAYAVATIVVGLMIGATLFDRLSLRRKLSRMEARIAEEEAASRKP